MMSETSDTFLTVRGKRPMKRLFDEVMPKKQQQQPTNPTIIIIDLMSDEEEEARSEKKTENLTMPSAVPHILQYHLYREYRNTVYTAMPRNDIFKCVGIDFSTNYTFL